MIEKVPFTIDPESLYDKPGGTSVTKEGHVYKSGYDFPPTRYDIIDSRYLVELIRENTDLRREIRSLISVLVEQNESLKELVSLLGGKIKGVGEEVISIREISREQAKAEIAELFEKSETLYFSDIAEELRLDLELVVELCAELQKEGKIKLKD